MLGAKVEKSINGLTTYTNIKNDSMTYNMLTLDAIAYITSLGDDIKGEVYNYQTFIKINLNDDVPDSITNHSRIDENENVITLKWSEWMHPNNYAILINETDYYMSSYAYYAGYKSIDKPDKCLKGSEIISLRNLGYTILNKEQFILLQNSTADDRP
jgi:hypothetical protein